MGRYLGIQPVGFQLPRCQCVCVFQCARAGNRVGSTVKLLTVLAVLFGAYLVISTMSYNDSVNQHEFNCAMIDTGAWPETVQDCK